MNEALLPSLLVWRFNAALCEPSLECSLGVVPAIAAVDHAVRIEALLRADRALHVQGKVFVPELTREGSVRSRRGVRYSGS